MTNHKMKVMLVVGGDSAERDVSLESGVAIHKALQELGHDVLVADPHRPHIRPSGDPSVFFANTTVDVRPPEIESNPYSARRRFAAILTDFEATGCEVVFNGLHGGTGEDGTFQAVLDYLGIPYTGSGMTACAIAMDKALSKQLVAKEGVPVPPEIYVADPARMPNEEAIVDLLGLPVVVKPNHEGSSVGVTIVEERDTLARAVEDAKAYGGAFLFEQFIEGKEITAAMLDGADLPLLEIRPRQGFYDYRNKYQSGSCEYIVPAPLDADVTDAIKKSCEAAYRVMGCRGYSRIDFRLANDGRHFFLETNTLPGMTANSLVPKAARAAGIDFPELIDRILHLTREG